MVNRRTLLSLIGAAGSASAAGLCSGPLLAAPLKAGATGLADHEFYLIAAMAEGILPGTDSPGAIRSGVPRHFQAMFDRWFDQDEQIAFRASLQRYDADAKAAFGKAFADCSASQQRQLLIGWDRQALAASPNAPHPFTQFKRMTVHGAMSAQSANVSAYADASQG